MAGVSSDLAITHRLPRFDPAVFHGDAAAHPDRRCAFAPASHLLAAMEPGMRTNLHDIPSVPALVGRETSLEMLRAWLHGDTPSCAVIGAAGVGKTALLRAFGAECLERGGLRVRRALVG